MKWNINIDKISIDKNNLAIQAEQGFSQEFWDLVEQDSADLDQESENEDCTFSGLKNGMPVICCDGVGSSVNPRLSSQKLTNALSNYHYDEIDNVSLSQIIQYCCKEMEASSTTCIAVWPKVIGNKLYLKCLQIGDGMMYLILRNRNYKDALIYNLCFAPTNQIEITKKECPSIDIQALIEVNANSDSNPMQIPVQISQESSKYSATYYKLGEEFGSNYKVNLIKDLLQPQSLFYREYQFSLQDIRSFSLLVGSDGAYDNLRILEIREFLSSEKPAIQLMNSITRKFIEDKNFINLHQFREIVNNLYTDPKMSHLVEELSEKPIDLLSNYQLKKLKDMIKFKIDFVKAIQLYTSLIDKDTAQLLKRNPEMYQEYRKYIRFIEVVIKSTETPKIDDVSIVYTTFSKY